MPLDAEIVAVGSELLNEPRADANSPRLAETLRELGFRIVRQLVMPDDAQALASALREACARSPLVICCGGLGSTSDDCTLDAAAAALNCKLIPDRKAEARIRALLRRRRRAFSPSYLRQARRLEAAEWLPNQVGSAAGQWCRTAAGYLVLLPGPPREMHCMLADCVRPRLQTAFPVQNLFTRALSIAGQTEAAVEALAAPIYSRSDLASTTILATADPHVELHFSAWGDSPGQAQRRVDRVALAVERRLGDAVFSRAGESLAAVVGKALTARRQTLAVAESCTGGWLGQRLSVESGASAFFLGGVVAYANQAKRSLLGVAAASLDRYGAASVPVAKQMAAGVRQRLGATWGVSITGIAGPGGGSRLKPVGTVFIGIASDVAQPTAARFLFPGDRAQIRSHAVQSALNLLRLRLLEAGN
ncbi:MAG: CinA family nicotinamide mononucleotide deamidase-related protein [Terriglobales bacterium]